MLGVEKRTTVNANFRRLAALDADTVPPDAERVYASFNRIRVVDWSVLHAVTYLSIAHNNLGDLSKAVLPDQLTVLNVACSGVVAMPAVLPRRLRRLMCGQNRLVTLPTAWRRHASLTLLDLSGNRLTSLDNLPSAALADLSVRSNRLAGSVGPLPPRLDRLDIQDNPCLSAIADTLPLGLRTLIYDAALALPWVHSRVTACDPALDPVARRLTALRSVQRRYRRWFAAEVCNPYRPAGRRYAERAWVLFTIQSKLNASASPPADIDADDDVHGATP